MTPEPTSDKEVETKEVETKEVETKEVETKETNIPTSKYFTEGNKSTGLQVEVCSTYNPQLYVRALVRTSLFCTYKVRLYHTYVNTHAVKLSCSLVHVTCFMYIIMIGVVIRWTRQ